MRIVYFFLLISIVSCKNKVDENAFISDVAALESEASIPQTELQVFDYDGLQKFLSTKSDKTLVVNFWATWCAPCIKELPYFEQLNSQYSNKNVEVILVSLDFPKKYDSNLKPFMKKHNLKSKVVALDDPDANTWIPKVSEDWSGSIPATLIINKSKRQFYERSFTFDELETEVKQFIK
ncbi:MAG: TlpA family protein disulfide reductase [Aquaticitalea sp.]